MTETEKSLGPAITEKACQPVLRNSAEARTDSSLLRPAFDCRSGNPGSHIIVQIGYTEEMSKAVQSLFEDLGGNDST